MAAKYRLSTIGCKVNQYESQFIRGLLESLGLEPASENEAADVAVVNTCAVTAGALRDNRFAIRRVARQAATRVIVVGCGATAEPALTRQLPNVAAVLGHDVDLSVELPKQVAMLLDSNSQCQSLVENPSPAAWKHPAAHSVGIRSDAGRQLGGAPASSARPPSLGIIPLPLQSVKNEHPLLQRIDAFAGHRRAFLKVQDGCDAFCTYCIIPRLRPVMRWKPPSLVVEEAEALVRAGHKEIILTGIFLGAYGRPTAIRKRFSAGPSPLASLVQALAGVDGLARLRLSSLEPGDVDDDLLEVLATQKACVPHLHLPLQSGSEKILRRMNRQYSRDAFLNMIERVRSALDRPAITTDILVGFPGETDADFNDSLEVARAAGFCKIHSFPFSPREGTAAARWTDQFVPATVMRRRMQSLADVELECSLAYRQSLLGVLENVLVEKIVPGPNGGSAQLCGRADRYVMVHFESLDALKPGDVVPVCVDRVTPTRTHATLQDNKHRGWTLPVLDGSVAHQPGTVTMAG